MVKRKASGPVGTAAGKKQGTLFSFFSKKLEGPKAAVSKKTSNDHVSCKTPSSATSAVSKKGSSKKAVPSSASASTTQQQNNDKRTSSRRTADDKVPPPATGSLIEVYWPDDDEWYSAKVTKMRDDGQVFLEYDDGEKEWIDISTEQYREKNASGSRRSSPRNGNKRRRIIEEYDDDEEEKEWEDDGDDDDNESEGSVYVDKGEGKDDDDDDDDQWMVSDDEDDVEVASSSKQKSVKKLSSTKRGTIKVSEHTNSAINSSTHKTPRQGASSTNGRASASSRRISTDGVAATRDLSSFTYQPTPKQVTPSVTASASGSASSSESDMKRDGDVALSHFGASNTAGPATHSPTATAKVITATAEGQDQHRPPMYVKQAVNDAGSHVHNHLNFLQNPRDKQGRAPDHPEYDPRTLRVVMSDWEEHAGKMTDAVKQWWDLKAQYFDTVLLFKTGKFYEMFHMDADIGVQVLGLNYMKGHVAHAGFPEGAYGVMADRLVQAGYKVARVEQTETPDQLKERKKRHKGKNSPKVVNREVCSIMTMGTRTFCFLDSEKALQAETDASVAPGSIGPLLAIREVLIKPTTPKSRNKDGDQRMADAGSGDSDEARDGGSTSDVQPVCEYGVTIIDAIRGSITIGQFADDILRSRMNTLLTSFCPSEILLQGGENGASPALHSMIRSFKVSCQHNFQVEVVTCSESFPQSTAIDPAIRKQLERPGKVNPWDVDETLREIHYRRYYPQASKKNSDCLSVRRWPQVLRAAVEGDASLAISSFGAALFYLQRNLIDRELLSMGIVKAYIPPASSVSPEQENGAMVCLADDQSHNETGIHDSPLPGAGSEAVHLGASPTVVMNEEDSINHLALDGTTLQNLEILTNSVDYKPAGSLWALINHTKTPHGSRLLRAWLLRPLFRKDEINRRADAVEELVSGAAAVAMAEATRALAKCGDIERLLSRIHSMSGDVGDHDNVHSGVHPNDRAVLYEQQTYTKRKVADFSKALHGLRHASRIPELFDGIEVSSPLLHKLVRTVENGGRFPRLEEELDWFFDNFDCQRAAAGDFEPTKGIDEEYDVACDTIQRIQQHLADYQNEMINSSLTPRNVAKSSWKYINTKPESKDKYLIELPASVAVPDDFIMKGKRGSGTKQVNKYRTAFVETLVTQLEQALDLQRERKARGIQLIFAKFDSKRPLWAAASTATAMLDALQSLAKTSSNAGYTRPTILDCPPDGSPMLKVVQGRHPCVEKTLGTGEFVPNDLTLGMKTTGTSSERILLLSGVNMGGKSTCLRQTCLMAILAQVGCFVPADECSLTPVDRIFTRLGASDRILMGQSTFFVELAETAAALRGATRRSLVIMDELGRGTSTFDGTAIASATVKHLVERNKCLSLFATHYHTLLDDYGDSPFVKLGHMECMVENGDSLSHSDASQESSITFLYTLGEGGCPKSFGINVARLAGLPQKVISNANRISDNFEKQISGQTRGTSSASGKNLKLQIIEALKGNTKWEDICRLSQSSRTSARY